MGSLRMSMPARLLIAYLLLVSNGNHHHVACALKNNVDLQIVDDFLMDEVEIQAFLDVPVVDFMLEDNNAVRRDTSLYVSKHHGTNLFGFATVSESFVNRVLSTQPGFGKNIDVCEEPNEKEDTHLAETKILTRHIYQGATPIHQDHLWDKERTLVQDQVGFIFLNDNPDAAFVMYKGDGGDSNNTGVVEGCTTNFGDDFGKEDTKLVCPKKGRLVVFDGSVPHNTIVQSGFVHLAGPFRMVRTLDFVGEVETETPTDTEIPTDAPFSSKSSSKKEKKSSSTTKSSKTDAPTAPPTAAPPTAPPTATPTATPTTAPPTGPPTAPPTKAPSRKKASKSEEIVF